MPLRCFVACAFGHRDVDALYDRGTEPTLRALKIDCERVDRVTHNQYIDRKIFELIRATDFCLADLTYARPSVYFEAGLAEGLGKPVIYTARLDHFHARETDPHGNLRVHFDLQMKNIIKWNAPDTSYCRALRALVGHVTTPILKNNEIMAAAQREQIDFQSLALPDRCHAVLLPAIRLLRNRGFRELKPQSGRPSRYDRFLVVHPGPPHVGVLAMFSESITKKQLSDAGSLHGAMSMMDFPGSVLDHRTEPVHLHCVLGSMRSVPASRVRDALPYHAADTSHEVDTRVRARPNGGTLSVHVVSPVQSPGDFADGCRKVLNAIRTA